MSEYSIYQADAFTSQLFRGNPAAIVPLADWLDEATLQKIAQENNLSETAYFTRSEGEEVDFHLRWFTPQAEIDLCGHATLATAHILFDELDWLKDTLCFSTQTAGNLVVTRLDNGRLQLDFPARPAVDVAIFDDFVRALVARPAELLLARDHMAVFATEAQVRAIDPDMEALARINKDGIIITAPADDPEIDFVSRFFAPNHGIPEDPVTGSAHCTLVPYWAEKLDKTTLMAQQISARGGTLWCQYREEKQRVYLAGN